MIIGERIVHVEEPKDGRHGVWADFPERNRGGIILFTKFRGLSFWNAAPARRRPSADTTTARSGPLILRIVFPLAISMTRTNSRPGDQQFAIR